MNDLKWSFRDNIPVAMTIAGSDSSGGAGISADLKTFAALGVYGTLVITAVTAQNTYSLLKMQIIDADLVEKQMEAILQDISVNAAKTGMLYSPDIIEVVAKVLRQYHIPLVVDPVIKAKCGATLLLKEAIAYLKEELLPLTTVITPNIKETEILCGRKVKTYEDMIVAAKEIHNMGPKAVLIKGGHLPGTEAVLDVLYYEERIWKFKSPRLHVKTTHGTGCVLSAAITAELAKGKSIVEAVRVAKELITSSIRFGLNIGKGYGPVNPMVKLYKDAAKYKVLKNVEKAMRLLIMHTLSERIAPEVGINLVEAIPYAECLKDVVGIPGRLRATGRGLKAALPPDFNASSHLARYVLKLQEYSPNIRAAVNIRFSEELLEIAKKLGFSISYYDRREEPAEIKKKEGMSIPWGVEQAIKRIGKVPDIIYHKGDWGKEPMIVILGKSAEEVVRKLLSILDYLKEK